MGFAGVAFLLLAIPALGLSTQRLLGLRSASRALQWGLAAAMGLSLTMLALYLPLVLGGRVTFLPALVLLAVALAWALLACVRERWFRRADRTTLLIGLVLLTAIGTVAQRFPFWGYDGKAIYGFKAKVLLHERNLAGAAFQDVDVVHYHVDYPLGLPLLMALAAYAAEGAVDDPDGTIVASSAIEWVERYDAVEAYTLVGVLWLLGILALLLGAARRELAGPATWTPWVLVFCGLPLALALPWIGGRSWSWEGADVPLALCLGAAGLAALRSIEGERGLLPAAFVCCGGAFLLKNDAALGIGSLICVLLGSAAPRRSLRPVAALAVAAGLFCLLVAAVRSRTAGSPFDERYALSTADIGAAAARVPELLRSTWEVLAKKDMLATWLFVMLVGIPVGWSAGGRQRRLAVWLALYLLACTAVFLLSPNELAWHVRTALPRLWSQMGVVAGMLAIAALVRIWRTRPARPT
jgi:hypothetical protein